MARNEGAMGKKRQLTGSDSETKNPAKGFHGTEASRRTPEEAAVARNWEPSQRATAGIASPTSGSRGQNTR